MAESQVSICNKALGRCGISEKISLITDNNPEADECEKAYDTVLDRALGKFDWGFARRTFDLVPQTGTPPKPWAYQYVYPTDVVRALRIDDKRHTRQSQARIPFKTRTNSSGVRLLLTNMPDADLIYTHREVNVAIYPAHFVDFMAVYLASEICYPLTKNVKLAREIEKIDLPHSLAEAISLEAEGEEDGPEPEASWVEFRDGPIGDISGVRADIFEVF